MSLRTAIGVLVVVVLCNIVVASLVLFFFQQGSISISPDNDVKSHLSVDDVGFFVEININDKWQNQPSPIGGLVGVGNKTKTNGEVVAELFNSNLGQHFDFNTDMQAWIGDQVSVIGDLNNLGEFAFISPIEDTQQAQLFLSQLGGNFQLNNGQNFQVISNDTNRQMMVQANDKWVLIGNPLLVNKLVSGWKKPLKPLSKLPIVSGIRNEIANNGVTFFISQRQFSQIENNITAQLSNLPDEIKDAIVFVIPDEVFAGISYDSVNNSLALGMSIQSEIIKTIVADIQPIDRDAIVRGLPENIWLIAGTSGFIEYYRIFANANPAFKVDQLFNLNGQVTYVVANTYWSNAATTLLSTIINQVFPFVPVNLGVPDAGFVVHINDFKTVEGLLEGWTGNVLQLPDPQRNIANYLTLPINNQILGYIQYGDYVMLATPNLITQSEMVLNNQSPSYYNTDTWRNVTQGIDQSQTFIMVDLNNLLQSFTQSALALDNLLGTGSLFTDLTEISTSFFISLNYRQNGQLELWGRFLVN